MLLCINHNHEVHSDKCDGIEFGLGPLKWQQLFRGLILSRQINLVHRGLEFIIKGSNGCQAEDMGGKKHLFGPSSQLKQSILPFANCPGNRAERPFRNLALFKANHISNSL